MAKGLSFGAMMGERPGAETLKRDRFRMAILGDFSGRAAKGELETGDALAKRRAIKLDVDTIEQIIEGFATTLVLPIGKDGAGIEVELTELDDLHPDELFEKVELFEGLQGLRRQLGSGGTADGARKQLKAWAKEHGRKVKPPKKKSAGNTVPADMKLTEFQKLVGGAARPQAEASDIDALLARVVGPHIVSVADEDTAAMQAAVDQALSEAMRLILHHPEFQSVEAQWRSLDLIARQIETDDTLDLVLYDISAEEIAADLVAVEDLSESGLYQLLGEGTADGRGNFSAILGLYTFEETPPHAELLGRVARLAAHMDAPFVAAITPAFIDTAIEDRHQLVAESWDALRAMPEAGHLGLVTPRFMLRRPYGAKSDPIYEFEFEEFTPHEGLGAMLWANPVVLVAILLAQSFRQNGKHMNLGSIMGLGEVPYHYFTDQYGDQVQLPCTERNFTEAKSVKVNQRGYMPVLSIKGRDEIRLGSFQSLAGATLLGPWSDVPPPPPSPASPPVEEAADAGDGADAELEDDDLGLDDMLDGLDLGGDDDVEISDDDLDLGLDLDDDSGLDDLLAGFDDETDDSDDSEDDEEMDPDLAALLADL